MSLPPDAQRELNALLRRNPELQVNGDSGASARSTPAHSTRTAPRTHGSEDEEQIALFARIEAHTRRYPDFQHIHHSPNGGKRQQRKGKNGKSYSPEGTKLKRMGTRAGFPDLIYPAQRGQYAGLAIELKVGSNKPTALQRGWLTFLGEQGWRTAVCYGADEAWGVLIEYETL